MPLTFQRGLSTGTQPPEEDGKIIYHTDTSRMYFDTDSARQEINANDARSIDGGKKLTSILPSDSSTNSTFPTSLAVHNYSSSTYMTKSNPVGSGTLSFDGDEELTGNFTVGGSGTFGKDLILNNSVTTVQAQEPAIKWNAYGENNNEPYIGFASDQFDGTFVWSLKGTSHDTGLAIGGDSGDLLWKGIKIPTVDDIPTSFTISATANDDDVVVLSGSGGINGVSYTASHAQKGPPTAFAHSNTNTNFHIPNIEVDTYGHTTAVV